MKNNKVYMKTVGFLTAAMTFAAAASACSSKSSDTSGTPETTGTSAAETIEGSTSSEQKKETTPLSPESLANIKSDYDKLFSDRDRSGTYDSITAEIELKGSTASVSGSGAAVKDSTVTITEAGVYRVKGELSDGQIVVNAPKAKVQIVLDNASVSCSTASPLCISDNDKTFITLAENSKNFITDNRPAADGEASAPDAAIFSEDSITINGSGSLTVKAGYCDGIHSKDDVVITGGVIDITAKNNGIKGKDYVAAAGGTVRITAENDGIKSTNSDDDLRGFVYIENGSFDITAGGDGIQAETVFCAVGGNVNITAGGGSENGKGGGNSDFGFGGGQRPNFGGGDMQLPTDENGSSQFPDGFGGGQKPGHGGFDGAMEPPTDENGNLQLPDGFGGGQKPGHGGFGGEQMPGGGQSSGSGSSDPSTKGIKAGTGLNISGGEFTVNAAGDTIHSNGSAIISGGKFSLESGKKAVHADKQLDIKDSADILITKSYEGIEAAVINVSGGTVDLTSSDDGFNASDGSSQGSMGSNVSTVSMNISGGTVYVNAEGDGIDSNGSLTISGGTVIVNGPQIGANGALDSNGKINVTGGLVIAAGSSGMAEYPDSSSTQNSVAVGFDSELSGGTMVTLLDSSGSEVLSFAPAKRFSHIVIASPDIKTGEKYTVMTGGTSSSKENHGLYENGGYKNDGTKAADFTADSSVSLVGKQSSFGGGGFGGGHGGFGGGDMQLPTDENGNFQRPGGGKRPDFGNKT